MIKVRNSLVLCRLIEKAEQKIGNITVPTGDDLYCEAEVIDVGPGSVAAEGGRSETFDLKAGQRVWIKYREQRRPPPHPPTLAGVRFVQDGEVLYIFEQSSIVGVIAEPA